jgi:peptidyl-prolyl cis-trans isomerase A (cyclophilin A)
MIRTSLFALFATTALLAQAPAAPPATKVLAPAAPAREPGLYATITTSMGPIVCILYEKESPITVKNFVALARGGTKAYGPIPKPRRRPPVRSSGTIFHQRDSQIHDPGRVTPRARAWRRRPHPAPDEFSPSLKFDKPGRLAMANAGLRTGTCSSSLPKPHTAPRWFAYDFRTGRRGRIL